MKYNITEPDTVKQELWNEESIYRMAGGFKLDTTNLPSSLETLPKGCMLNVDMATRIAKLVKTAKVKTTSGATDTTYQIEKGHALKEGDVIAKAESSVAYTIQSIDTLNDGYDVITVNTTLGTLTEGDVLFEAAAETANSSAQKQAANQLNYYDVRLEGTPSVVGLGQAYEIKEENLPFPVHDLNKASLTFRFMFV